MSDEPIEKGMTSWNLTLGQSLDALMGAVLRLDQRMERVEKRLAKIEAERSVTTRDD